MAGEFPENNGSEFQARPNGLLERTEQVAAGGAAAEAAPIAEPEIPKGGLMERVEEVKKAREIMESAMHNVENTIKGIEPMAGESPEDLLLRIRAAVHNTAFAEVNKTQ